MQSRKERIDLSDVGTTKTLRVTSVQLGWYDAKIDALKDIYSLDAVNLHVVQSPWYKEQLAAAVALENAGDFKGAADAFNKCMNASQMSFNVINRTGMKQQFVENQRLECFITTAEREQPDGSMRTSIIIDKPYALKATPASSKDFDFTV